VNNIKLLIKDLEDVEGKGADPYYFLLSLYPLKKDFPKIDRNIKLYKLCRMLKYDYLYEYKENINILIDKIYEDKRYKDSSLKKLRNKFLLEEKNNI
jgi:hypothetical protein